MAPLDDQRIAMLRLESFIAEWKMLGEIQKSGRFFYAARSN
jgi:hypothetical protein